MCHALFDTSFVGNIMVLHEICLIDENKNERESYAAIINMLLSGTGVTISPTTPLSKKEEYSDLLIKNRFSGFILDQKLEDGGFDYSGSDLAIFIRAIDDKLPIFILTNYKNERAQFVDSEKDVEYIYAKSEVTDPLSQDAQVFKARLLRRLNVFAVVRSERQQRFHELLTKSMSQSLSVEELDEMGLLEEGRLAAVQVSEVKKTADLEEVLGELRKFLAK